MAWFITSVTWYGYLFIIGLIFFPLAAKLFSPFIDHGYPFAKTIGIIVGSYLLFILGIFHIIPFTQESILFLFILISVIFYKVLKKQIITIKQMSARQMLLLLGEELLFFVAFIWLVFTRGQEPSVHGLEKFMDYGFMQSILRSHYFPPLDMWLSADPTKPGGYPINYYYFGHLSGAFLIKFTGVIPSIGYNFILATIFAQGMTLAFSFSANIVYLYQRYILKNIRALSTILFGALGCFLVNFAGNLHTIYLFTQGYPNDHPEPFWKIFQPLSMILNTMKLSDKNFIDAMVLNSKYWYPNATRFIPFTIHEFPSYSYVVADLHGHVFDIPFVLLSLALLLVFFVRSTVMPKQKYSSIRLFFEKLFRRDNSSVSQILNYVHLTTYEASTAILFGFMIAIHYMTNAFDGPIYMLLMMIVFFYLYRISVAFAAMVVMMGLSYVIFSLPFSYFFSPFVSAIGVNCPPAFITSALKPNAAGLLKWGPFLFEKGNCQISEPWMLFVLWGFFVISAILLATAIYVASKKESVLNKFDVFVGILFGMGIFLLVVPEFFYIKDIYPAHFRANTMFKLGYQAFIMMSLASTYVLFRLMTFKEKKYWIWRSLYILPVLLVSIYPLMAFPSYYPGLYDRLTYTRAPEIDGAKWLENQYPHDKEIIDYINTNISGQPVILEAQGDSYTDYDRISAYTGTPTIAGWWVHEWLWRGSADVVGKRIPEITSIYESPDKELTRELLKKYNVSYVVVSKLEKDKYPNLQEDKFNQIGSKIFVSSDKLGALYRVY
ncbi:DUF2298 domain-containing protein [soil metagenome]